MSLLKKMFIVFYIFSFFPNYLLCQITIGDDSQPAKAGLLELKEQKPDVNNVTSTKKGLILPRVTLKDPKTLEPFLATTDSDYNNQKKFNAGTIVYNLTDDINFCPGVYIWNSSQWSKMGIPCPELPNSYFVTPGTIKIFPVKKPYVVWNKRSDLSPFNETDKLSVELLWQDTQSLISSVELDDGDKKIASKIKVTTTDNKEGNALIALHIGPNGNSTDPIIWSWHIWVTNYNPDTGGTIYPHNNGEADYIFMDRNLGSLSNSTTDGSSMGFIYQWGRKDPFTPNSLFWNDDSPKKIYNISNVELTEVNELQGLTGTGIKHIEAPASNSNLAISIHNPTSVYYGSDSYPTDNFDWFSGGNTLAGDDTLWNTTKGDKSYFDPCPEGWRVPAYSTTKSPWSKYLAAMSWFPTPPAYYTEDPSGNGADFGPPDSSSSTLGFYPYGFQRIPVSYITGPVGSGVYIAGGTIGWGMIQGNRPNGFYWTATPAGGNAKAKFMYLDVDIMMGNTAYASEGNNAKALGAAIRCVKK